MSRAATTSPPAAAKNGTAQLWDQVEALEVDPTTAAKFERVLATAREHLPEVDEDLIRRAFRLAYWAHNDVTRRSGEAYITHPLEVAGIVAQDIPFDDETVAAALLHDVVEDNSLVTVEHIHEWFGEELAVIVDGLTKMQREFESRAVKQAENFRKLLLSMASDIRVILVKFADRLHNMRTIDSLQPERQMRIAVETRDLFAPLAHRFGLFALKNELEDLSLKVIDPKAFYTISRGLRAKKKEREAFVERFIQPVRQQLAEAGLAFDIYGRPKHIMSIYRKMRKQGKGLEQIYDLFAIRIILHNEGRKGKEDCWRAYSIITDSYRPLPERFRDFISVPKSNGYQSLHTTVIGPGGKPVEVQIRTREMHEIAELGVAAHWKSKEGSSGEASSWDKQYAWVRDLLENPDSERATEFVSEFQREMSEAEVYVFTPRGDLMVLPKGATPIDFAFRIHSEVGLRCTGARVNEKYVPLSYQLQSGDQVEIVTSKNKTPNPDWLKFAVTHRARSRIRHWIREGRRQKIQAGREIWEKRARKAGLEVDEHDLQRYATKLRFANTRQMFFEIGEGLFDVRELVELARHHGRRPEEEEAESDERRVPLRVQHERFLDRAQSDTPALLINGEPFTDIATSYATCCNPIPGDAVFGYLSRNGGMKIHRANCHNAPSLMRDAERIMPIEWSRQKDLQFMAALRIVGTDRVGIVSDVTDVISKTLKTNIRSLSISSEDGVFEGTFVLDVRDLPHLRRVMERVRRIEGIVGIYRFEE